MISVIIIYHLRGSSVYPKLSKTSFQLSLQIVAVIAMGKFKDWVKRKLQRDETRDSSVDPAPLGVTDILCKPLRVNVEIINGECYVENGDKHLNAICNETIAGLHPPHLFSAVGKILHTGMIHCEIGGSLKLCQNCKVKTWPERSIKFPLQCFGNAQTVAFLLLC